MPLPFVLPVGADNCRCSVPPNGCRGFPPPPPTVPWANGWLVPPYVGRDVVRAAPERYAVTVQPHLPVNYCCRVLEQDTWGGQATPPTRPTLACPYMPASTTPPPTVPGAHPHEHARRTTPALCTNAPPTPPTFPTTIVTSGGGQWTLFFCCFPTLQPYTLHAAPHTPAHELPAHLYKTAAAQRGAKLSATNTARNCNLTRYVVQF